MVIDPVHLLRKWPNSSRWEYNLGIAHGLRPFSRHMPIKLRSDVMTLVGLALTAAEPMEMNTSHKWTFCSYHFWIYLSALRPSHQDAILVSSLHRWTKITLSTHWSMLGYLEGRMERRSNVNVEQGRFRHCWSPIQQKSFISMSPPVLPSIK